MLGGAGIDAQPARDGLGERLSPGSKDARDRDRFIVHDERRERRTDVDDGRVGLDAASQRERRVVDRDRTQASRANDRRSLGDEPPRCNRQYAMRRVR
jgi:hypothetical protein